MKIIRSKDKYTRDLVRHTPNKLFIFTDNTDRDSGKGVISSDSWYSKKYGEGKHYPTMTSALIRGLDNAYPITTQRYYNKQYKGNTGSWNDSDLDQFKEVIDDDFKEIIKAIKSGKYEDIVFPPGGIFNSQIANISKERTPKLFDYLMDKCQSLYDFC